MIEYDNENIIIAVISIMDREMISEAAAHERVMAMFATVARNRSTGYYSVGAPRVGVRMGG